MSQDLSAHAVRMEGIYRSQVIIYDLTRKFFLLGRDRFLNTLPVRSGSSICEVGCGTGRNLRRLYCRHSDALYFGLDVSPSMLESAKRKVPQIHFQAGYAESFRYDTTFGLKDPFDLIFFSYSLTMVANWQAALYNAARNLRPDGVLAVIDFCDQGEWPHIFATGLKNWLSRFHVAFKPEMLDQLDRKLSAESRMVTTRLGRYYFTALLSAAGDSSQDGFREALMNSKVGRDWTSSELP